MLGHDTMFCIVTGVAWERMARHNMTGRERRGMQQLATRPCDTANRDTTRPACARGERQHVRTWPSHWSVSRYKMLYRGRGAVLYRDTGCYTELSALRYGAGALLHGTQRPTIRRRSVATRAATRATRLAMRATEI